MRPFMLPSLTVSVVFNLTSISVLRKRRNKKKCYLPFFADLELYHKKRKCVRLPETNSFEENEYLGYWTIFSSLKESKSVINVNKISHHLFCWI